MLLGDCRTLANDIYSMGVSNYPSAAQMVQSSIYPTSEVAYSTLQGSASASTSYLVSTSSGGDDYDGCSGGDSGDFIGGGDFTWWELFLHGGGKFHMVVGREGVISHDGRGG